MTVDFGNEAVGGTTLVLPAIQSPNYVEDYEGWQVNSDGSAQFNSLDIQGNIVVSGSNAIFVYAAG